MYLCLGDWCFTYERQNVFQDLHKKQWVCEAALWLNWAHLGNLCCVRDSQLLFVGVRSFIKAIAEHPLCLSHGLAYATEIVKLVNTSEMKDVSDLFVPRTSSSS